MEKQANQPGPLSDQEYRKKFALQAGLSIDQLQDIEIQQPKRQRRQRKDPIVADNFTKNYSQDTKTQFSRSPGTSISRQQTTSLITPRKQPKNSSQLVRTPQVKYSKDLVYAPKSVDEFYQNYISFSSRIFKDSKKETTFIEANKKELFELFERVVELGGIVKIISQGHKNEVFRPFLESFKTTTTEQIFNIYKRFLLHFEYQILQNYTFKEYHNAETLLKQAIFVDEHQLRNFLDQTPLETKYFDQDITVFRNGQNAIHIDSNTIHLDRVAEHYQNYNIDIRIQKAMDYGFKPRTMRNEPYQMKIGHYRIYQKLCEEYAQTQSHINSNFIERLGEVKDLDVNGTSFKDRISSEQIFFGVNFDPDGTCLMNSDGLLFEKINEKVDNTFLGFKQEFDLLSYLDQQVPGCSFPQFYFKVKGVWTGGHQENINMCSVNINHGPDASEWYSMEFKYVEQFRAQLKKEHKMDLYGSEGLWYEKINWFMEQGKYPVKKIIQKKGDIVVSGPGTLHWVRSHGIALQSAWNQFPITLRMMKYAFWRQEENERINFIRSNTIPLKILTLKLLNYQPPQLTPAIKKLCVEKLKMWMEKEEQLFEEFYEQSEEFPSEQPRYEKLEDLQGFCTKCRQEILIYFVNGKKVEDILCLNCYKKEYKNKKKTKRLYIRNNLFDLNLLIKKSELGNPFNQLKAFVSQYVGKVPLEKKDYKMDKQSVLIDKINAMNQELNRCDSKKVAEFMKKLKNKRSQSEEQEEQKQPITQKKSEPMELQTSKEHKKCEQSRMTEQKFTKNDLKPMNNKINYIGETSANGWRSFQIPETLRIVTQQNYTELLKHIYNEDFNVKTNRRAKGLSKLFNPYFVVKDRQYLDNQNKFIANPIHYSYFSNEPKFSSDQEGPEDKIKKKVHKNQDLDKDSIRKNTAKQPYEKNFKNYSKPYETAQDKKIKVRSSRSESKRSKSKQKHKKKRSSRSKSHQKQRKRHKKSRSRSQKSSKNSNSNMHQERKRSPCEGRRSKSQRKSPRRQTNRGQQQRQSRSNKNQSDDFRNNHRRDQYDSGSNRGYRRDNQNGYTNEGKQRQDRRNDYGGRDDRKQSNWNDKRSQKFGSDRRESWCNDKNDYRNHNNRNHQYRDRNYTDSKNGMNYSKDQRKYDTKNYSSNPNNGHNRQDAERNYNYERRENYGKGYRGGNYRNRRQNQREEYHNSAKQYQTNHNPRRFNSDNTFKSQTQNKNYTQQENRKTSEDKKTPEDRKTRKEQKINQSSKILQEKHQSNDIDY